MPVTVCWFIQSHRDPEQILRLVRTLRHASRGPIVLRHDHVAVLLDVLVAEVSERLGVAHPVGGKGGGAPLGGGRSLAAALAGPANAETKPEMETTSDGCC